MGLKEQAEADLAGIVEDDVTGFGWPVTVTNPAGTELAMVGLSTDIAQVIDPDTGTAVSGRMASVALRTSTLYAASFELPRGIADSGNKPWIVQFNDINGLPYKFKVAQSNPDRAIGMVTCLLEAYK